MADETWTRYQLKQQLFSIGEGFWIENERGEAVYRVDGKALTLRETFLLEDRGGSELATIQAKLLAFMPTMTIQRGGQTYATVKKVPFTLFHQEYTIEAQGGGMLEAKGDFTDHEYEIRAGEQPVAEISRRWFSLRETYGIAIAPGQDEVLLLSAAVCIDEMSEDERKRRQGPPGFGNLPGFR
jgi:uncharacterized protein YxjI